MENKTENKIKKNKKFIIIPVVLIIVIALGIIVMYILNSPQVALANFFNGIKNTNKESVNKYISYNQVVSYLITDDVSNDVEAKLENDCFKKLEYKINTISIQDNKATINVETTNINFRNALTKWTQDIYKKLISGETMTNEQEKELLNTYLEDESIGTMTVTKDISLVKEDGNWKIQNDQNLEDALFPGLSEVVSSVNSLVNEQQ